MKIEELLIPPIKIINENFLEAKSYLEAEHYQKASEILKSLVKSDTFSSLHKSYQLEILIFYIKSLTNLSRKYLPKVPELFLKLTPEHDIIISDILADLSNAFEICNGMDNLREQKIYFSTFKEVHYKFTAYIVHKASKYIHLPEEMIKLYSRVIKIYEHLVNCSNNDEENFLNILNSANNMLSIAQQMLGEKSIKQKNQFGFSQPQPKRAKPNPSSQTRVEPVTLSMNLVVPSVEPALKNNQNELSENTTNFQGEQQKKISVTTLPVDNQSSKIELDEHNKNTLLEIFVNFFLERGIDLSTDTVTSYLKVKQQDLEIPINNFTISVRELFEYFKSFYKNPTQNKNIICQENSIIVKNKTIIRILAEISPDKVSTKIKENMCLYPKKDREENRKKYIDETSIEDVPIGLNDGKIREYLIKICEEQEISKITSYQQVLNKNLLITLENNNDIKAGEISEYVYKYITHKNSLKNIKDIKIENKSYINICDRTILTAITKLIPKQSPEAISAIWPIKLAEIASERSNIEKISSVKKVATKTNSCSTTAMIMESLSPEISSGNTLPLAKTTLNLQEALQQALNKAIAIKVREIKLLRQKVEKSYVECNIDDAEINSLLNETKDNLEKLDLSKLKKLEKRLKHNLHELDNLQALRKDNDINSDEQASTYNYDPT